MLIDTLNLLASANFFELVFSVIFLFSFADLVHSAVLYSHLGLSRRLAEQVISFEQDHEDERLSLALLKDTN